MVNYGASHACITCKSRRIRCDEGKPTCQKCAKSRRTCLGYKQETSNSVTQKVLPLVKAERHSAKIQTPSLSSAGLDFMAMTSKPDDHAAFTKFFSEFVLIPKDRCLSRGYFDGLENLIAKAGCESEVYGAARTVALANFANISGSNAILRKANSQYLQTILSFQEMLKDPIRYNSDEALMTAVLLGLYEMMVASDAYPHANTAHLRGVSAILHTRSLPADNLPGARLFRCVSSIFFTVPSESDAPSLFSPMVPSKLEPSTKNLDELMLRLRPVLLLATEVLSNPKASKVDLHTLKQKAVLLNKEFCLWPLSQPKEWAPKRLGTINVKVPNSEVALEDMPFWPGNIDSYFDLYVVAIWDTYRKSRLKLLQVIFDCSKRLCDGRRHDDKSLFSDRLKNDTAELVDGLCASIPFHLVADLPRCLQPGRSIEELNTPGKALGGLLLMYPLYIASTLSLISSEQRTWLKGRLRWIGEHMGIRQATMLSNTDLVRHLAIADGHALVSTGSLISAETKAHMTKQASC